MKTTCLSVFVLLFVGCCERADWKRKAEAILHDAILQHAEWAMRQLPETVTDYACSRSVGGVHDFYSEGDYWWPNPDDPDGPYIRRDGETNPENFTAHRLAMIRFSKIVGYLASAYLVTGNEKYAEHAFLHIRAWFVDEDTRMNPNLLYAQAIKGVVTGRGVGIIDTVHLMEVAQGILCMQEAQCVQPDDLRMVKQWFVDYLAWLVNHPYGVDEMNAQNNHATCWVMQVAAFARLTSDESLLELCRMRYKEILLPQQMASDGSFPKELARTKPYGYSLFNLDAMATICRILSVDGHDLWNYTLPGGRNMKKGIDFMLPYIRDKQTWMLPPDVMYWDEWPIAHPALIFAAARYDDETCFETWRKLEHYPVVREVERNLPIRNPLIWMMKD
jgi:hypothetical protein